MPGLQRSVLGSLVLIAAVVTFGVGAFAYTAGWLNPRPLKSVVRSLSKGT
jgi:catalase